MSVGGCLGGLILFTVITAVAWASHSWGLLIALPIIFLLNWRLK